MNQAGKEFFFFFFLKFKLFKHNLQYKAITGATYNNTIYIPYITNNMTTYSNYNAIYSQVKSCACHIEIICSNILTAGNLSMKQKPTEHNLSVK